MFIILRWAVLYQENLNFYYIKYNIDVKLYVLLFKFLWFCTFSLVKLDVFIEMGLT